MAGFSRLPWTSRPTSNPSASCNSQETSTIPSVRGRTSKTHWITTSYPQHQTAPGRRAFEPGLPFRKLISHDERSRLKLLPMERKGTSVWHDLGLGVEPRFRQWCRPRNLSNGHRYIGRAYRSSLPATGSGYRRRSIPPLWFYHRPGRNSSGGGWECFCLVGG